MSAPHWTENCDGTAYDQVGQSDYGTFWVARRSERKPEVCWTLPFRRRDPRCWRAWFNSVRRNECTFLEAL